MLTGLFFVILGLVVYVYPRILVIMLSACLMLFGLGMMVASYQFRRMQKRSGSRFINWIIRW